jgi:hypothetical protein
MEEVADLGPKRREVYTERNLRSAKKLPVELPVNCSAGAVPRSAKKVLITQS